MLADSVTKWWDKNKNTWTRFTALKEALSSDDEQRQGLALQYLRFDKTMCDGLTIENYKTEIEPLVQKIKQSKNGEADQAKYLLDDNEYYWFKSKQPLTAVLQKRGFSYFYESEVLNSSFVHLMKFSAKNPRLRKAAKR